MSAATHTAQTLDRGLQILELLANGEHEPNITEIAKALDVHRTIAHRLVATLEQRDFVTRSSGNRYQLGTGLLRLSGRIGGQLRAMARPALKALNQELDETVHLVVLAGTDIMFLDAYESSKALRVTSRVGQSMPAHTTSVGKAMLARLPEKELAELYPNKTLSKYGPNTITSRAELFKRIEEVRQLGYAISSEESEAGVGSVGVAIVDPRGIVRAGASIAAPLARITPANIPTLAIAAQKAAKAIGDLL